MPRLFLLLVIIIVAVLFACSCRSESLPPVEPAPAVTPVPPRIPVPDVEKTVVATEGFSEGVDGWIGIADDAVVSEVSWYEESGLQWTTGYASGQFAGLLHHWPELDSADGLTINLVSVERDAMLVLGVQETDESVYCLPLNLEKGCHSEYTVHFDGFGLHPDTVDENGKLDIDQLSSLVLVDISSVIMAPDKNSFLIDEITLWKGTHNLSYFSCGVSETENRVDKFRIGVDANFIPQAELSDHLFRVYGKRVDPLELFAVNGADSLRLRLWVGDEGNSKLNYATELAERAMKAGLEPYLVLFLSDYWSDVNKQPVPEEWAGLTVTERAEAVRRYSYETARHFIDNDIDMDFYEIGNEIDYGICGVFAFVTHPRDISSLKKDIWPDEARLIQAAVEGIREADPGARIMLHIASSGNPTFALAFFESMIEFGVDYDYIGLSYYPTAFGMSVTSKVCETMNLLSDEIGKPIIIAETAYPAEVPSGGMFQGWRYPIPGYSLTPEGQAAWLSDMFEGMRDRGDIAGVYVFSPEFWFSGDLWGPFALFDSEGNARPGIGSFELD